MSEPRSLPSTVDYSRVLPLAVESRSRRRTFFPNNGQNFSSDGNNIIRIDVSASAFLDPKHSYLRFNWTNNTGQTCGLDFGGGHGFIRRLRIEQAGNVLSDCQNYNKLMSAIILPSQGGVDNLAHRSVTEGVRFCNDGGVGNSNITAPNGEVSGCITNGATNSDVQIPAIALGVGGTSYTFTIPLLNGLLGTTQSKMVPLQLLGSSPLTIEIELAPALDIGVYAAGIGAAGYDVSDIRYVASLIEVGPEVDAQLRMVQEASGGRLVLNGVDYTHFAGNIAANSVGPQVINVPARRKSLKSLFFVGSSQQYGGAQSTMYNLSHGGNFNMNEYHMKIGSMVHPPTPIQANLSTAVLATTGRSEAFSELAKCWGTLGSINGTGILSRTNYATLNCNVASIPQPGAPGAAMNTHRFAPFGIDLESWSRGVNLESGVNTADRSLPISLIVNIGVAAVEAINVDCYVSFDSLYYIDSVGNISVSL
tara:strand:+ start:56 stop:1492 length:1437 start_codon:yes stop_codon:yes gene_type:complete